MKKFTRRQFLGTSTVGLFTAGTLSGCAEAQRAEVAAALAGPTLFDRPVSFQSFGMKSLMDEDFHGTLSKVHELGYAGVEMCSPIGYARQPGFRKLTDVPAADIKQQIADTGLFCKSAHFGSGELIGADEAATKELAAASTEYAKEMGLDVIYMSGSGIGNDGTMDQFRRWGELCSVAGEVVKAGGLQLGYHNHAIGPMMEDGETLQYDLIMEVCDPDLVWMQFQLASISGGYDIVSYLDKYAGRFGSLHIHDYDPEAPGRQEGSYGSVVPCGEGIIDWPALLKAAAKSDIPDHGFTVEIETDEPFEGLRRSLDFLRTVEV